VSFLALESLKNEGCAAHRPHPHVSDSSSPDPHPGRIRACGLANSLANGLANEEERLLFGRRRRRVQRSASEKREESAGGGVPERVTRVQRGRDQRVLLSLREQAFGDAVCDREGRFLDGAALMR
jgi:hypothetical protein